MTFATTGPCWSVQNPPVRGIGEPLAAVFEVRGYSKPTEGGKVYFGFERPSFGIVHVRTDVERLLIFTHSGKKGLKEAYRFREDAAHTAKQEKVKQR